MSSAHYLSSVPKANRLADDGASYTRMSGAVANRLAAIGFEQPVDVDLLPEKWWVLRVDAAAMDDQLECGGAMVTVEATTTAIVHRFDGYFCEVVGGPFETQADLNGCVWVEAGFDRLSLGAKALPCVIPGWIVKRLAAQGQFTPLPFSKLADAYWVCGMGGGVVSTHELEEQMRSELGMRHGITNGPFNSHAEATYAFDVLWESPE